MPDPTLESLLLQRATSIGPDPMAGPISDYPGAKIGMMGAAGTPGKLSGMLKGITEPERDPVARHVGGWIGQHEPTPLGVVEEMARLATSKAVGTAWDHVKAANAKWRSYTGHNLIPKPTSIINKLLGTNYGNGPEK